MSEKILAELVLVGASKWNRAMRRRMAAWIISEANRLLDKQNRYANIYQSRRFAKISIHSDTEK